MKSCFTVLLILQYVLCESVIVSESPPLFPREVLALKDFFFSTHGSDWLIIDGWDTLLNTSKPVENPCHLPTWYGVSCLRVGNWSYINKLELIQNNLESDEFPVRSLSNLTYLEVLDLSSEQTISTQNSIQGNVDSICSLSPTLQKISLSLNSLSGKFPQCLMRKFKNLLEINLYGNNITGITPNSICKMATLQHLNLGGTSMSGTIPICFGKLKALKILNYKSLGSLELTGGLPTSLCDLRNLESLQFTASHIGGSLPACFGTNQSALQLMEFSNAQLTGSIPLSLCRAESLRFMTLADNDLTGSMPFCLGSLTSLKEISLSGSHINGSIPYEICALTKLRGLFLNEMSLSGTLPSCFNSPNMFSLNVNSNRLTGTISDSICNLVDLKNLELWGNRFSGSIPDCLGSSMLSNLGLSNNDFSGTIPFSFCQFGYLQNFGLSHNSFIGTVPDCLGSLYVLNYFLLDENLLTGPIPNSICDLYYLSSLNMSTNHLSGPIPDCLGLSLPYLDELSLSVNELSGTLPPSLCNLTYLSSLMLHQNDFGGTIPACFGVSFSELELLFLHDNNLHGALPSVWKLARLNSIVLSNNRKLNGPLPASLFHQGSHNTLKSSHGLKFVVIEGTRISGSIPSSICGVSSLQSLLLSGNLISGTLPDCFAQLQQLVTFRAPRNQIKGNLILNIKNMSLLANLDLSNNRLSGTIPESFGDMSTQLIETKLAINHLSCKLPKSVLEWQKSPDFQSLSILAGNLFACPDKGMFTLYMKTRSSKELAAAEGRSMSSYSCGGSAYVIPVLAPVYSIIMLLLIYIVGSYFRIGGFKKSNAHNFSELNHRIFEENELRDTYFEMRRLSVGIVIIGCCALFVMIPATVAVETPYSCQYTARITIGGKHGKDTVFSACIGAVVAVGFVSGTNVWFRYMLIKVSSFIKLARNLSLESEGGGDSELFGNVYYQSYTANSLTIGLDSLRKLLLERDDYEVDVPPLSSGDLSGSREGQDISSAIEEDVINSKACHEVGAQEDDVIVVSIDHEVEKGKTKSCCKRALMVFMLVGFMAAVVVGPNVLYVFFMLARYSYRFKLFATIAIALLKVFISTVTVPRVARLISRILFPNTTSVGAMHRMVLNISVFISAISTVFIPMLIVLLTDERCFLYYFQHQAKVTSDVSYTKCSVKSSEKGCLVFNTETVQSTYEPTFSYNEGQCVSAVLSTYAPVFLAFILFSAPMSACFDLVIVPLIAPWCYRNKDKTQVAAFTLFALRSITYNVPSVLSSYFDRQEDVDSITMGLDVDHFAQRVVLRAYQQFSSTLLIALTYGLAAPLVGAACLIAEVIQFHHHTLILSQIVDLGELMPVATTPKLHCCNRLPWFTGITIASTTLLFWSSAVTYYIRSSVVHISFGVVVAVLLVICTILFFKRSRGRNR